ncbi:MAG: pyridoxamine 5'-phosphate oxidase family protein [Candidatus Omnitrophota bacterium]|nr:pyridoxamine 5'-phosphate oxidase family protein [Candidatus Omnitrophota bacterium]
MKKLTEAAVNFFRSQGFVVVSTVDKGGSVHNSCKGIVKISRFGKAYLFDLYRRDTYRNLKRNPRISITAVNEHKFTGYCLKGKAGILAKGKLSPALASAWDARIAGRVTQRLLRNVRDEKGHPRHPEILLPEPEYLIEMEIEEVVDLTPRYLK